MIAKDEGALSCDFAEVYHIPDWRALPARRAALFAYGLGDNSRIKRILSGQKLSLETRLLTLAVDLLQILVWQNTEDGLKGRNRPKSILSALSGETEKESGVGFNSAEEFEAWRASLIGDD